MKYEYALYIVEELIFNIPQKLTWRAFERDF